jgi:hypothetical protein
MKLLKKPFFILFAGFLFLSASALAADPDTNSAAAAPAKGKVKTIYPENQTLDFEGLNLEGELKAPGEFYFQNRNQERFDTLTKRRLNFRREMLRDSVQSN